MGKYSFDVRDKKGSITIKSIVALGFWERNLYVFCTRPLDFIIRACSHRLRCLVLHTLLLMVVWSVGAHTASAQQAVCDPFCGCGDPTVEMLGGWFDCMDACIAKPPCDHGTKDRSKGLGSAVRKQRDESRSSKRKTPSSSPRMGFDGASTIPAPTNCTGAKLTYLAVVVNRDHSGTVYTKVGDPLNFGAHAKGCFPHLLWEIDGHTRSNQPLFIHTFREPGEYDVKLTALCREGCGELVDRLHVMAMRGHFTSDDQAPGQFHITPQKPVVSAAFFVEPRSQLGEFIIIKTRDVNIRNQRQSGDRIYFDVSKSDLNNEYGAIIAIHKRYPAVRFGATVVDGRVQVMDENGRTLPKSAYEADQALKALMRRLDVLTGEPIGAITAGTLDQLGYEKAFEAGKFVSGIVEVFGSPTPAPGIERPQGTRALVPRKTQALTAEPPPSLRLRPAPMKELGTPPRRAGDHDPGWNFFGERVWVNSSDPKFTPNPTFPREPLTLPSHR